MIENILAHKGEIIDMVMAGNIRSTSLVFVLEFIKNQIITGAESFTEEVTDDD